MGAWIWHGSVSQFLFACFWMHCSEHEQMNFVSGMFCSALTNREVVFIEEILCRISALGNEVQLVAFLWKSGNCTAFCEFVTVRDWGGFELCAYLSCTLESSNFVILLCQIPKWYLTGQVINVSRSVRSRECFLQLTFWYPYATIPITFCVLPANMRLSNELGVSNAVSLPISFNWKLPHFALLQAFGNAKTAHNNNSSRFGKFIQVNYLENGVVRG